ncbi:MAG: precorrin-6y C5,15-methyltransferase (decarboxylating) subunit CbiE [Faecalicatena sp.]|uniref:precorrin-6y C5,15-methyltransferase (decarboxylating) subunit CbiE n=1 Tax=Faecalicatena sp. TaxID=2005360 RepID=UPI002583853A|nr:precorrin-6y C5,15-methyltransferase (decarboxylating) subunit CbiE [Faecalicatena sp.]MCI6468265.1 precorrin-6y C5,15-methyltransferase (decarboxylating) subunit CbiE [Faecalicatena sp.]MDY5620519.1 precorrin-6y C5,15-methyltransferase (decarboxylating) subunit CbiE [Lachnospiraceae bacterium]
MCKEKQRIYLVGIGMGTEASLTIQAKQVLESCDRIIGAKRMLDAVKEFNKPVLAAYKPGEIKDYIVTHSNAAKIAVVLSGDAGFYSGAKKLEEVLTEYEVERIPGISSIIYLAAKLHISWEDAALVSVHGRKQNYIHAIATHEKTFLLLSDRDTAREFCEKIRYYGLEKTQIWVGSQLSYEDEVILHKKAGELRPEECLGLDVAYIYNPEPDRRIYRHLEDEEFIRGKVPMTKSEIRAVSLAKLALTEDAVLYDVGAGTGSVSIEAAVQSGSIKVYAVEKNPEGVSMIRENKRKFLCDWLEIVEGTAPEALKELKPPTHVFIGGSSGNLKEIITCVKEKNPEVRIVLNAISLETVKEVMEAAREGILEEPEIIQIMASRSKKLGAYHMMTGLNPVYIITEGKEQQDGKSEISDCGGIQRKR